MNIVLFILALILGISYITIIIKLNSFTKFYNQCKIDVISYKKNFDTMINYEKRLNELTDIINKLNRYYSKLETLEELKRLKNELDDIRKEN